MWLKPLLSNYISQEQFGFLKGRFIHEAIGSTQEGIHTIKTQEKEVSLVKIDLSKSHNRLSWLYLQLLLLHIGFELQVVKWIMACVTTISFAILINGPRSSFFKSGQGLRQGCPLSPLFFLLVVEGLSRAIA